MTLRSFEKYRSWFYSAGIAVLVGVWLLSGQFSDDESSAENSAAAAPSSGSSQGKVRVRTQVAEEITRTIVVNGKTAPARIVELSAETDGRITSIGAKRGSNVDAGTVIVRMDERDRGARLAEASAIVKQREVEYEARAKLMTESYVSEAQLQEGVARLEGARAELKRAQLDLEYMVVRAPFDGAIQSRVAEVGDFLKVGDPIAVFVDNRSIIVSANVSEFDARYVKYGANAEAKLATGEEVSGTIRFVSPVADEATRTFQVELEVDNRDGALLAGGTAELYIPAETIMAHRISPSLLTLDDAGNIGTKIIDEDGKVQFIVADIAQSSSNGVWVAGLPESVTLITVGQGFVTSGSLVDAIPEDEIETTVARKVQGESD